MDGMRLVLFAGVLCTFVLASPSAAHGAVPRGFVGVMGDGPLFSPAVNLDREVDLMARAGQLTCVSLSRPSSIRRNRPSLMAMRVIEPLSGRKQTRRSSAVAAPTATLFAT